MKEILDDRERAQRQQHRRLIITEVLMFLAVLALVGFLTLVVMGYSFNLWGIGGSGEVVERTGLVQISSIPTGASIYIDGESPLLLSTNASRTMLAGEHEIALKREGFYDWSKMVKVTEGLMYRLNYPRLFRIERETETVLEFRKPSKSETPAKLIENGVVHATGKYVGVSPNHEKMLFLIENSLYVLNLNENEPKLAELVMTDKNGNVIVPKTISKVEWSGNSERMLAMINEQYAVVNIRNPKETVWLRDILANCAKEQGLKDDWSAGEKCDKMVISEIKFESETGDRLLVLGDKNELLELNVRDGKISKAILDEAEAFDNDNDKIIFIDKEKELRAQRVGENDSYLVVKIEGKSPKIATMRYFQENYVAVVDEGMFTIYAKMGWVTGDEEMEKVFEEKVGFEVKTLKKRGKGVAFEIRGTEGENKIFDIEAMETTTVDATGAGWIDEYLRYRLKDGKLSVLDYDGLNEHELVASGVLSGRTVTISGNNQWLYYFTADTDGNEQLVREKLI